MQMQGDEIIDQFDLISINALVELLADQKGFHRENAYYLLEVEFNVSNVKQIKRRDLLKAITILADLKNVTIH
jgi:hypothetical protein